MTRGKNIIIICGSETPAGVSEPLFFTEGVVTANGICIAAFCESAALRGIPLPSKTEGVFPTRENGNPERPQTLRVSEIINNFSLAYAQSAAEGIPNHFRCSSMVWMRVLAR